MKVRLSPTPPQGTNSIVSPEADDRRVDRKAKAIADRAICAILDKEFDAFEEAWINRDKPRIAALLPTMKARYGSDLFTMMTGKKVKGKRVP